jgi:hypothetical protein
MSPGKGSRTPSPSRSPVTFRIKDPTPLINANVHEVSTLSERASEAHKVERRVMAVDSVRAWGGYEQFKVEEAATQKNAMEKQRQFVKAQAQYHSQKLEEKRQARQELAAWSKKIEQDAEMRRQQERDMARERERRATERLKEVAQHKAAEETLAQQQKEERAREQAKDMQCAF